MPSEESSISIPLLAPGRQWLNPKWIALKEGTQSRDVDELFNVNVSVVQNYTEMMEQGLWEWKREPLPVAFLSADGKIYAGDCYHRAMAAITVGENLYVNLLSGKLVDAILYSCQANTYHGLLLRPKDQRKRIELFLDTLENLDEARSHSLLDSIPGLSEAERRNCQNKWSARVIAKYLRLTESGYRTIINIQQERELALKFTQFAEGDWVSVKPDAEVGKIHSFDKRKGVFVVPTNGTGVYIHPDYLEKTDAPIEIEKISQATAPTSVQEELKQKAEKLGIPVNGLPEVERNEGDPSSLVDNSFATPGLDEVDLWAEQLSDEQIDRVWSAIAARRAEGIAPRVPLTEKFSRQIINLESFDNQDLQDLIAYANELLESRQGGMVDAS
ncbi:MAG: hypothetical protein KME52_12040 [Desmonostoc geniculatum HA4340-LM1]|nr:hypothetical protein [Desmonostoc geniculatum HA4340-LM1]